MADGRRQNLPGCPSFLQALSLSSEVQSHHWSAGKPQADSLPLSVVLLGPPGWVWRKLRCTRHRAGDLSTHPFLPIFPHPRPEEVFRAEQGSGIETGQSSLSMATAGVIRVWSCKAGPCQSLCLPTVRTTLGREAMASSEFHTTRSLPTRVLLTHEGGKVTGAGRGSAASTLSQRRDYGSPR